MVDAHQPELQPQQPDPEQVEREERKLVEETEKAGGTVHEFNPDASPQEKAAALRKVLISSSSSLPLSVLIEHCRPCR